jgi:glycosyltransferase involved in cell wall biosynthesis
MRFSLIVATRGRDAELAALFDSLLAQQEPALEVIVVDQNADDRLVPVIAGFAGRLTLRHLRSTVANANHARNLGLTAAQGAIVGFPDDDCTLPPGVLTGVWARFAADRNLAILTGPAASPEGGLGSGRWRDTSGPITVAEAFVSIIEFNLFLRRAVALALGGFDIRLGPGTPFGSAEGNDLVLRALAAGYPAWYDRRQEIVHPDKRLTPVAVARAALYGKGLGLVLRRHRVPARIVLPFFIRPIGGMLLAVLRGQWLTARYYAQSLRGRMAGMLAATPRAGLPLPPLAGAAA